MLLSSPFDLTRAILLTLAFAIAVAAHEANHAFVATALGDDTPRRAGRLTLNPIRHIDITGLVMFLLAGIGWGWTPVNPEKMKPNPRLGNALVAMAGPAANLGLALAFSLPLRADVQLPPLVSQFLFAATALNLLLFVFNLIPLPPLDGFSVLMGVLPSNLAALVKPLERYGFLLILALLFVPSFLGVDVLGSLFQPVSRIFGLPNLR